MPISAAWESVPRTIPEVRIDECGTRKCETTQLRDPIERGGHNRSLNLVPAPQEPKGRKTEKRSKDQRLRIVKCGMRGPACFVDVRLIPIEKIGKERCEAINDSDEPIRQV
jgi:hypothetical protein